MGCSLEFIDGVVGVEGGNARYTINDSTEAFCDRYQESFKLWRVLTLSKNMEPLTKRDFPRLLRVAQSTLLERADSQTPNGSPANLQQGKRGSPQG
jgi:hypothetical protein